MMDSHRIKRYFSSSKNVDTEQGIYNKTSNSASTRSIRNKSVQHKMFYTQEDISNRSSMISSMLRTELMSRSRLSGVANPTSPIWRNTKEIDIEMAGALNESPSKLKKLEKEPSLSKNGLLNKLYSDEDINSKDKFVTENQLDHIQRMKTEMNINAREQPTKQRTLEKKTNVYDSLSEDEMASDLEESNTILNPNSERHASYHRLIFIAIIYSLIFDCIKIISTMRETGMIVWVQNLLTITGFMSDCVFIFDCLICFFIPFKKPNGSYERKLSKIFSNYIYGKFAVNLLASFPINLITYADEITVDSMFIWIFIIRILKLRFNKKFRKMILTKNLELNRILKFLIVFFLTIHNISCLFIFLAYESSNSETWMTVNNINEDFLTESYIASIYFHLVTIFTIGFGDITPVNKDERIYNCFLLTTGVLFFSFGISSLSDLFSNKNGTFKQRQNELFDGLCRKYKIPENIKGAVNKVIKSSVKKNAQIENFDFIKTLPNSIKHKLTSRLYELKLKHLKFFKKQSHEFILYALQMIKTAELNKRDNLIGVGEFFEEFYMIKKGKFSISVVISEDLPSFQIGNLNKGNHFGDVYLFYNQQCSFSIKCIATEAELYMISRTDYSKITQFFRFEINNILLKSLQKLEYLESVKFILKEISEFSCSRAHLEESVRLYKQEYVQNEYALTDLGFSDYDISVMEAKNRKLNELVIKKIIRKIRNRQRNNLLGSHGITMRRKENPNRMSTLGNVDVFEGSPLEKHINNIEKSGKKKKFKHNMLQEHQINRNVKGFLHKKKRKLTSEFDTIIQNENSAKEAGKTSKKGSNKKFETTGMAQVDLLSSVFSQSNLGTSEKNVYKMEEIELSSEVENTIKNMSKAKDEERISKSNSKFASKKEDSLKFGNRPSVINIVGCEESEETVKLEDVMGLLGELRQFNKGSV